MRVYVEADSPERADALLRAGISAVGAWRGQA
ncbi:hypothetical protein RAA17_12995 [Komagataeibacter rhaeticus]|nr:hypothetical protein [Komagataeibacter rhaeticus]